MWGHYNARGQIGTVTVRAALAGPVWALHSIVNWEAKQCSCHLCGMFCAFTKGISRRIHMLGHVVYLSHNGDSA